MPVFVLMNMNGAKKWLLHAALVYKCVEVAYLKAAYYKHRSASKDRQELQAAVQIARGT